MTTPALVIHDTEISVVVESPDAISVEVNESASVSVVIGVGEKGDPGDRGDVFRISSIALSGQRAVIIDDNNQFAYADSGNINHIYRVAGITVSAFSQGVMSQAQRSGIITEPTWNWEMGKPVFLGSSGFITQIVPSSVFTLVIGYPIDSKTLHINYSVPFIN